jgi:hypothetical protein
MEFAAAAGFYAVGAAWGYRGEKVCVNMGRTL